MSKQMQTMQSSQWSDLPPELVSNIAERLEPIELLKFRGVCKDWNSASSTASVQTESKPNFKPWFLLYGEEEDHKQSFGKCQLVTETGQKFTMRLPELDGAICLASNQGWLLVFKQGSSMFFFRPFSRTKINLPKSPHISKLSDHVAAFSCPPICQVCVMNHVDNNLLMLNVLSRGASEWIEYSFTCSGIGTLKCAAYQTYQQKFYFINHTEIIVAIASQCHTFLLLVYNIFPNQNKHSMRTESVVYNETNYFDQCFIHQFMESNASFSPLFLPLLCFSLPESVGVYNVVLYITNLSKTKLAPTRPNLASRHITTDVECVLCNAYGETSIHLMKECPYARCGWSTASNLGPILRDFHPSSFKIWLGEVVELISKSNFEMCLMICWALWGARNTKCWALWGARNTMLWQERVGPPEVCVSRAIMWWQEFIRLSCVTLNRGTGTLVLLQKFGFNETLDILEF